jgi:hypothetical protein
MVVCSVSHADLLVKITADDAVLTVGQTTTLRVYGLAEEAVAGNGLYDWGVSAVVDTDGIVQAHSGVFLEPSPLDAGNSGYTANLGASGNMDASALIAGTATGSNAGVGYSELFNFQIEAIGLGVVQYSLSNILGDLFDFSVMYDDENYNVQDSSDGIANVINVVPEPATLLMLGLGTLMASRRKK